MKDTWSRLLHRYDPLAREPLFLAVVGISVFLLALTRSLLSTHLQLLEIFLLLSLLVVVPLALSLCPHPMTQGPQQELLIASIRMYPVGALLGAVSIFLRPGPTTALLAVPWVLAVGLASLSGLARFARRGFASAEELAIDLGLMYLPMAGFWFVAYRLGTQPLGVPKLIVLLAAVHFINAGFTALFLTGITARWLAARGYKNARLCLIYTTIAGLVCPIAVAFAIAYSWRWLELSSAFGMEAGYFILSLIILLKVVPHLPARAARYLLGVSGAGFFIGMCFAMAYTFKILSIPQMVGSHGYVMSMAVCLCGLTAWVIVGPISARQPREHTYFQETASEFSFYFFVVFVGQMLLTARLVTFWKLEPSGQFTAWFSSNLSLMNGVLMPLGATAGICLLAAMYFSRRSQPQWTWFTAATVCWMLIMAAFPLFFLNANKQLATLGALSASEIAELLRRWGQWHYFRIVFGLAALPLILRAIGIVPPDQRDDDRWPGVATLISSASAAVYGLFTGTLLLTAILMIGWQRMSPADFLSWFGSNAQPTSALLMPLASLTGLLAVASLVSSYPSGGRRLSWMVGAVAFLMGIFLMNLLFFNAANAKLVSGLSPDQATVLLRQWANWHWVRLLCGLCGLYCATRALRPAETVEEARSRREHQRIAEAHSHRIGSAQTGDYQSVAEIAAGLEQFQQKFVATQDRRALFATTYLTMIHEMRRQLAANLFSDQAWIARYSLALANRYRRAILNYDVGSPAEVPECWRTAFTVAGQRSELVAQDLLLALNAHINYDHTMALVDVGVFPDSDRKYQDYFRVNAVLTASIKPVMQRIAQLYAPGMAIADDLAASLNRIATSYEMERSRDAAWRRAVEIARAPDEPTRIALETRLEESSARAARELVAPNKSHGWLLKLLRTVESSNAVELPPGNLGLPWLGQSLAFARDPAGLLQERFKRYGPVSKLRLLGNNMVCLVGPEAFGFLTDERRFAREGANPPQWRELMDWGCSPLIDGERRLRRKRLVLQSFTPEAVADYVAIIQTILTAYLARWERMGQFSWLEEFRTYSFAVADALYLGSEVSTRPKEDTKYIDRCYLGMRSIPVNLPFTAFGRAIRARNRILQEIEQSVRVHRDESRTDVMSHLLAARDEAGSGLTVDEIKMEVLQFYYASWGAMYAVLSCLVIALAQYPEVRKRARDEVIEHLDGGPITLDALNQMGYLDQVTREVRRYYPLVATTLFTSAKETCEFGGYLIPQGWKAIGAIATSLHYPETFRDPESFDPSRFSAQNAASLPPNSYVAHGAGAPQGHRCSGEALADAHLKAFLAMVLPRFEWELPTQDLTLDPSKGIPFPRDGLQVVFRRRAVGATA
jgi:cytochrome P450